MKLLVNVSAPVKMIPFDSSEAESEAEGHVTGSSVHYITHSISDTSTISISH